MAHAQPIGEDVAPSSGLRDRALHAAQHFTEKRRARQLERLQASRQAITDKLREVPNRMQKLVDQMRLLLDLVDDYASGNYRGVSWYSLGVAVLAVLYFLSPGDLVPDWFPVVGQFDDLAAVAIALHLVRRDLQRYAEFKRLDPQRYF
jgi:uncharacterized membrane protein YkvA (DUF1232 family)